jgi:hypothetical protein
MAIQSTQTLIFAQPADMLFIWSVNPVVAAIRRLARTELLPLASSIACDFMLVLRPSAFYRYFAQLRSNHRDSAIVLFALNT